jgi:ParB family transcriptional regulator, chromosome partitioning protein
MSKKVLGRGLGAFFPEYQEEEETDRIGKGSGKVKTAVPLDHAEKVNVVLDIPVAHIRPNPSQPRKEFNDESLDELAESIRQHGLIQPITVRYLGEKRFELISGERRLRASKLAGLREIPGYIREVDDEQILTLALIENIQREDLTPLEVAMGYERLMEEMGLTQAEVAGKVGKNRSTVTNMLRLLNLPDFIQAALRDELISTGHARALINLKSEKEQKKLLKRIISQSLSVRQVEEDVRGLGKKNQQKANKSGVKKKENPFLKEISDRLKRTLSTKVDVKEKNKGGEIRISYYSDDDLERILQLFEQID